MRIGVVCEGATDFVAIDAFFGQSLADHGIEAEFVPIQPEKDKTSPEGGWGNVLHWLQKKTPAARKQEFFNGGLFADDFAQPPFDCLLIHLDTDILGNTSFKKFIKKAFGYNAIEPEPGEPTERAREVSDILRLVWQDEDMTKVDQERHVPAVAVESTENWCVAAFSARPENFEALSREDLANRFMSALERSERRDPKTGYKKIDKSPKRREKFRKTHKGNYQRIASGCHHFQLILDRLLSLSRTASAD